MAYVTFLTIDQALKQCPYIHSRIFSKVSGSLQNRFNVHMCCSRIHINLISMVIDTDLRFNDIKSNHCPETLYRTLKSTELRLRNCLLTTGDSVAVFKSTKNIFVIILGLHSCGCHNYIIVKSHNYRCPLALFCMFKRCV